MHQHNADFVQCKADFSGGREIFVVNALVNKCVLLKSLVLGRYGFVWIGKGENFGRIPDHDTLGLSMNLDHTRRLLTEKPDGWDAKALLVEVLRSSIELLSIEDNDFSWSSWENQAAAVAEVRSLLSVVEAGELPDRIKISVLFVPTGPIQEVSLSSGWADPFFKVFEQFANAEKSLWS